MTPKCCPSCGYEFKKKPYANDALRAFVAEAVKNGRLTLPLLEILLSRVQFECVKLRFFDGYDHQRIAYIRSCDVNSVRICLVKAMKKIEEYLNDRL